MDIDFLDKFQLFTNYTYQDASFNGGANDGKYIPFVPKHQANAGLSFKFLDGINLSFTGRYVGMRYPINDLENNLPVAKPYFVVDSKISYEKKNFEVYAALNNIFNEMYSTYDIKKSATSKDIYPAPEMNFDFGVNVKF